MYNKIANFFRGIEKDGLVYIRRLIKEKFYSNEILRTKKKISAKIFKQLKGNVKYGPFKGMKMLEEQTWGVETISKLLGNYEKHVVTKVVELSDKHDLFVDIGAADGYFAIGFIVSESFSRCICYESSPRSRAALRKNASVNSVEDKIKIEEYANHTNISKLLTENPSCFILCDIEGGEFELFDDEILRLAKNCTILIELHHNLPDNNYSSDQKSQLLSNASAYFSIEYLNRLSPSIYEFPEMVNFSDDERLLAFSEGRPVEMEWVLLSPKNASD